MNDKKSFNTRLIVGISIAAGALAFLIIASIILGSSLSPKNSIKRAIKSTYGKNSNTIMKYYAENGGSISLDAEISGEGSSDKLGLEIYNIENRSSEESSTEFIMKSNNKEILSGSAYGDSDSTYIQIDGLTDGYMEFEKDDFVNKYNASAVADLTGSLQTMSGQEESENAAGGVAGQIVERALNLLDDSDIEYAGKKAISINGAKTNCKKYEITIDQKIFNNMLEDLSDNRDDSQEMSGRSENRPLSAIGILQQLLENQTQNMQSPGGAAQGNSQMMPGQSNGQMPGQSNGQMMPGMSGGQGSQSQMDIRSLLDNGISQDAKMTVYIQKNKIRRFEINLISDNTSIQIACRNNGKSNVTYDSDWILNVDSDMLDISCMLNINNNTEVKNLIDGEDILDVFNSKDSKVEAFIDTDEYQSKVQEILEAMASLRGASGPGGIADNMPNNISPYGNSDEYGNSNEFGGYNKYGGSGNMGPGSGGGPGMGMMPGMGGGPGMGMMPGMGGGPGMGGYPNSIFDSDEDTDS